MLNQRYTHYLFAALTFILYVFISYGLNREDSAVLMLSYLFLFGIYGWIITRKQDDAVNFWVTASILFRIALLFAIPNLSDDVFRFIWDGRLMVAGHHPFAHLPSYYMESSTSIPGISEELYLLLNSQHHFTVYPPVAQLIFYLSTVFTPSSILGSVIIMKFLILLPEIGSIVIIKKLLQKHDLPERNVLLYALNPLIILEFTGNLHFEGVVIFFLLLSFYLLRENKLILSAIVFSLAIGTKLIPLIFLPMLLVILGWKKAIQYYAVVGTCLVILFLPMIDLDVLQAFKESLELYFFKFEFNASIYYAVREWGFWKYGYNIIQTVGWKLGVMSTVVILVISFLPRSLFSHLSTGAETSRKGMDEIWTKSLFILTTYLFFTTTVHPWYATPLIAFCVFTPFRFPIIWSLLIFFTYIGYSAAGYRENFVVIVCEYVLVIGVLMYEIIWQKKLSHSSL